ncbi:MAG TPA: guanine permease [Ruminococcaceae bacterium]|jgi:AGZA family xanthine/uracil permease-like MFS transporter|nr:guanine permease [Oscillospiraceae bacterium]HBQ47204.1 guanine permease [Oscillospiraceae bacterium]HBT91327.1 guanine permease [Oscillospiraceae bacterium]
MEESKKTPYRPKGDFFDLKRNRTNARTEILAGLTTFFTMSYILFVNPQILGLTGMNQQAVFLATIIASSIGTLVMGLFANVPYALAPGMGLNAFFTYTVCFSLGFKWQQALAMVFICGVINILITVTKFRKSIIRSIPKSIQNAIGGGIGIFVAYIGIKSAGLLNFTSDPGTYQMLKDKTVVASSGAVPAIVPLNTPSVLLALFGIVLMVVLLMANVRGAILIGIIATTVVGIPFGVTDFSNASITAGTLGSSFSQLGTTFGAAFGPAGMGTLFADPSKRLLVIMTIFAFSLSDTFDTIGTFIGTGRRTGIFSMEDEKALENSKGFRSKMDRALFADSIATSIGALFGTSNTTTYVESAAGIGAGGRTGLTSVTTAVMFLLCTVLAPIAGCIPAAATAPALVLVGVMMMSSFREVNWPDLEEAIPAFGAGIFMALCYSISYGIAAGFIFYCIVKIAKGKFKEIHPILLVSAILFILNFIVLALI